MTRKWRWRRMHSTVLSGLAVGIGMGVMLLAGMWLTGRTPPSHAFPPIPLHASGSSSGQTLAMATGMIDESEGLFVLDFLTGNLNCFIINWRQPNKFTARFATNVVQVLGVEQGKKPDYVMVTGTMDFRQGAAFTRPAGSIVYVADANTGNFAAWAIPWNRQLANTGASQQGPLVLLDIGKARNLEIEQAAPK
ncbi:MAG: hypothetical protein FJ297_17840 [Planctomycetes bacterium]|nr:hypothetical protein [Planctomycetota bacterium]